MARRDHNGILWIGTTEGLNSFDGNRISSYFKYQYPELADNSIEHIVVDDDNRIWLRTSTHQLTMLDKKRKFYLLATADTSDKKRITNIFNSKKLGIIALKGNKHFIWKERNSNILSPYTFPGDTLLPVNISFMNKINDDTFLFYGSNRLVVIDYARPKVLLNMSISGLAGAAAINNNELIAYPLNGNAFYRITISTQKISAEYRGLKDQFGQPV